MTHSTSLKNNLLLYDYIIHYLGLKKIDATREMLKHQKEGYDSDGKSYFYNSLKGHLKIDENRLEEYDENIKSYLVHINKLRTEKINLKYFQYLAILFTEIFLDNRQEINKFLDDINVFSRERDKYSFDESDLTKLAYWMATGSGKTLIMHINYLQYHKYNKKLLDNIILISPDHNMSKQHREELRKSNIPAKIFDGSNSTEETIQIIDIHKLTDEKKGEGVSVEVSSFEGNNLIFVDEGHKGLISKNKKKWKSIRDNISKIGFTFEYSATFEEAISSNSDDLIEEYSKAIIFDYSYNFFYNDGYGKDFTVVNLKDDEFEEYKEFILLYNLLSYYQQIKYFKENKEILEVFSFEKPLWIFVGNKVNKGVSRDDKDVLSDLEYVLKFLNKFLISKEDFIEKIRNVLEKKTFIDGETVLSSEKLFTYLNTIQSPAETVYEDIINLVFNAEINQQLELRSLDNTNNEIALRVFGSTTDFGLINIGNKIPFIKNVEEEDTFILTKDKFSPSIFDDINKDNSPIKILLGARKFVEGWNSYRVSNMGLLNKGADKGAQIIQLFGRGVRLKGYKNRLKRTEALISELILDEKDVPKNIKILETLNIFGIKANYIDKFQKELEKKGIVEKKRLILKIKKNQELIEKKLVTLRLKDSNFDVPLALKFDKELPEIKLNLKPQMTSYDSAQDTFTNNEINEKMFPLVNYVDLMDWDRIFFDIYDFKQIKEYYNLYFNKNILKRILKENNFKITVDETINFDEFSKMELIESLCVRVLSRYIQIFYNKHKRKWATNNMEYHYLSENDDNFQDYNFIIDKREKSLIETIKKLIDDADEIYTKNNNDLSFIHFDKHLYQPIIGENRNFEIQPLGLNEGEKMFITDLKKFFFENKDFEDIVGFEFFILRNLSRKGVGIVTETYNFYPDFIIWAVNEESQKIIFVDPKGLIHGVSEKIDKIKLNNTLKEMQDFLGRDDIELSSYILSTSPFDQLRSFYDWDKEKFEENNVLFQEDEDYIEKLISKILA